MIIVTGGAGFIGSNIVRALNRRGIDDILLVDNLENGRKVANIADLRIADYMEYDQFLDKINSNHVFGDVRAIIHEGACSATTEWNGRYVMQINYDYSKALLQWCLARSVSYIYASSASVYGLGEHGFREDLACELPINMYAYSKFQFDQYVRRHAAGAASQVVGLRYFNVYGPGEAHKGSMASTAFHFSRQIRETGVARLFAGVDGYADGEQQRDFVYVGDCVDVNLWFLDHPERRGIFNCGTGKPQTFNDMARAVIATLGQGRIEYIPFPDHLKGAYQSYTCADLAKLRAAGYDAPFKTVEEGVKAYVGAGAPNA
ncbi:ADP-glyceromanno-heptose 6-epimerase [Methylosinus sp. Sm6]|uniref:ADP-glyceromanno-heptose 6-epimerase n=1 Tax=Methylosinus sp. Sm6 TaxID=2866948 RepID=UPI001C9A20E6|nr:ADP-glyceromanno-heptose 6-epimerase [Methylosinus sp. Sm6]MBY6241620.1 ADP-glyceromanno-heptose 6-epimerase [Methylosinus sp. Sm6]